MSDKAYDRGSSGHSDAAGGEPAAQSGDVAAPRSAASDKVALNVLVLDDSFADYDAMRRALSRMDGFSATVTRARTLEEARLARSRADFHVVLIDFNLGTESGARFFEELGGRCGATIPILVTGLLDRRVQDIALEAGALAIVNKSDITPRLLEATIRSAMHTQRVERQLFGIITAMSGDRGT